MENREEVVVMMITDIDGLVVSRISNTNAFWIIDCLSFLDLVYIYHAFETVKNDY